jgi:hypothetical protein
MALVIKYMFSIDYVSVNMEPTNKVQTLTYI